MVAILTPYVRVLITRAITTAEPPSRVHSNTPNPKPDVWALRVSGLGGLIQGPRSFDNLCLASQLLQQDT